MIRGHPLIHMIPAPHQRLPCVHGHSHSHETNPTSAAAMGRGYPLIHMIPAPHQQWPCVEDSAHSFKVIWGPRGAKESPHPPAQKNARK